MSDYANEVRANWRHLVAPILAKFILEDEKLVTDGISSDRITSNVNLRMGNRLKVATNVNCKIK